MSWIVPVARPFIFLFKQDRADATDNATIGEDSDHHGAPLDLAVEALDRGTWRDAPSESHVDQHVGLGVLRDCRTFGSFGLIWSATARHCMDAASGVS